MSYTDLHLHLLPGVDDGPPDEAAANVAYLKQMLSRKDNPRAGGGAATVPVAALNRPD